MRVLAPFLGLLLTALALSGCIEPGEDENGDVPREPVFTEIEHEQQDSFTIPVTTGLHVMEEDLPGEITLTLPGQSRNLTLAPAWSQATNAFRFVIERPDGETDVVDLGDTPRAIEYATPAPGTYRIHLRTQGLTQAEEVQVETVFTWIERVYDGQAPSSDGFGGIVVVRDGDGWRATLSSSVKGQATRFDLAASIGEIHTWPAEKGEAASHVTVDVWAEDQETARDTLLKAVVDNKVKGGLLVSKVGWESGCCPEGTQVDVRIDADIPAEASGDISCSSGDIVVDGGLFTDLDLSVSSGDIHIGGARVDTIKSTISSGSTSGSIEAVRSLAVSSSSGDISLKITPIRSLTIDVASSSGEIALALVESDQVAYDLSLSTSSGEFTSSMSEAELSYPDADDEDRAVLKTKGGSGRSIQVTGSVATSSGDQDYTGA